DGHSGGVRYLDDGDQVGLRVCIGDIEDGRRVVVDGGGILPGLGIAHAGTRIAVGNTHLDQFDADGADGVVIEVAMTARHHDTIPHAPRVGQAIHLRGIEAGDTRRRRQQQARGRADALALASPPVGAPVPSAVLAMPHGGCPRGVTLIRIASQPRHNR
ncbi:MAG: hypothetical protein VX670_12120, partial [Candidatus Latescibacterota bacterium]|nr:hypothetical protein [Candidatus Latescibacterota bacterium]